MIMMVVAVPVPCLPGHWHDHDEEDGDEDGGDDGDCLYFICLHGNWHDHDEEEDDDDDEHILCGALSALH